VREGLGDRLGEVELELFFELLLFVMELLLLFFELLLLVIKLLLLLLILLFSELLLLVIQLGDGLVDGQVAPHLHTN